LQGQAIPRILVLLRTYLPMAVGVTTLKLPAALQAGKATFQT
jgi:hypothetical protein